MPKTSYLFYLFIALMLTLSSCENCDDCGPLQKEPSVTLKFINQDSLLAIEDSILIVNNSIDELNSQLAALNIELEIFTDSLQAIDLLIAGGDESLSTNKALLEGRISEIQTTFEDIQNSRIEEEGKITRLEKIASDIESGKVRLDSLISKTNETTLLFEEDSLLSYKFPLSVNLDSTSYQVFIGPDSYDLAVEYERNFNEDEKSRIEIVVSSIRIKNHTFKDVINSCEDCLSNETSITVFF